MIIKYNHIILKKYEKKYKKSGYYGLTTFPCLVSLPNNNYSVATFIMITSFKKNASSFNKINNLFSKINRFSL